MIARALFFIIVLACSESTAETQIPAEIWERLLAGETLVTRIRSTDDLEGVRVHFVVRAERARIWAALTDYDEFQKVFPRVNRIEVLKEDSRGATVEMWTNATIKELHFVLRRDYVEPGRILTWRRLRGHLQRIEGSWQIVDGPTNGVHVLVYTSYVDVGPALINWTILQGAISAASKMPKRVKEVLEE